MPSITRRASEGQPVANNTAAALFCKSSEIAPVKSGVSFRRIVTAGPDWTVNGRVGGAEYGDRSDSHCRRQMRYAAVVAQKTPRTANNASTSAKGKSVSRFPSPEFNLSLIR